jgi:TetR/AcrR family transcriptional regulator, cholesterol catabolism regulator
VARKPARNEHRDASRNGAKSARTRQRILDAAAHVLSRRGYAGTRLIDVAEVAQIQAPAIYYYFPSREDLIEEVMWSGVARLAGHVKAELDALPPGITAMDRIEVAVESQLRYELEISDYSTAAIRNGGQIPDSIRVRFAVELTKYLDIWQKLLQDAEHTGELRAELDPRAARMLVLGALSWAVEWWNPRRGSLEQLIRTAKSIVRAGLSAEAAAQSTPPAATPDSPTWAAL